MTTLVSAVQRAVERVGLVAALVEVGDFGDRRPSTVTRRDCATDRWRAVVQAIVAAFDPTSLGVPRRVGFKDALQRLTDQGWTALQAAVANNGRLAQWYERAKTRGLIVLEDAEVKTALVAVVAAGLFTMQHLSPLFGTAVE